MKLTSRRLAGGICAQCMRDSIRLHDCSSVCVHGGGIPTSVKPTCIVTVRRHDSMWHDSEKVCQYVYMCADLPPCRMSRYQSALLYGIYIIY